jgi:hypothetical protein
MGPNNTEISDSYADFASVIICTRSYLISFVIWNQLLNG